MVPQFELTTMELVILGLYIAGILGVGYWVGRKKEEGEAYFLAGRASVWPVIGLSMMSANLSGTSYIGLAGVGYDDGISVWNYEWMATLVLVFFALFVLPLYLRAKISTVPEFLEKRYDRKSRFAFSAFTVFTALFIDAAGAMFAGGIALKLLFPDVSLWVLIASVAVLAGLYVVMGGLSAVMITDTIQGILLLTAGGLIFVMGLSAVGSWEAVRAAAPPGGFSVVKPVDDEFLPWPGIFSGVVWLAFYYWATNHIVVQKALSAKHVDHGRWGVLFCGFLQLPLLFLLIIPGVMGRVLYPELPDPDMVWPALALHFMPEGLRGLMLAALVAALMSTLDSALNGASSLVTNDFIRHFKPNIDGKALLVIGRVLVATFTVVAAAWAPQIQRFPTIVEYFQSFLGHITMPVVVVFLAGLFWRRATGRAAFVTLLLGFLIGLTAFIGGEFFGWFELQFLYATGVLLILSLLLLVFVSLATPAPDPQRVREVAWSRQLWQEEGRDLQGVPLWKNHRALSMLLVMLTIGMVAVFV